MDERAMRQRYDRVRERIADAAAHDGRDGSDVTLVAVTKTATPEQIRTLVRFGQRDLGENRVQQLRERVGIPDAGPPARWHMVGHLQRNKVEDVLPLATLIHSVDRQRLVEEIDRQAAKRGDRVDVLIQVNVAGEPTKHGVAPEEADALARAVHAAEHVRLRGLMVMTPYSEDPERNRPFFDRARTLFEEIREAGGAADVLSMGMTNDFDVAVRCGANMVRVGRALFEG